MFPGSLNCQQMYKNTSKERGKKNNCIGAFPFFTIETTDSTFNNYGVRLGVSFGV